jgi:outer membrane protein OmpA-like peptidoglycan-associated protein
MKKLFTILLALSFITLTTHSQILKKIGNKVKNKTEQRADQKVDQGIDKGLDKAEEAGKKKEGSSETNSTGNTSEGSPAATTKKETIDTPAPVPVPLKVYQNYDFVPGDKIVFEDNFTDDQDGEFPTHWELKAGQAVLNKLEGTEAFYVTEGNYARLSPRIKIEKYLSDPFTIEYDYYYVPGAYYSLILLKGFDKEAGYDRESSVSVGNHEASFSGVSGGISLSKSFPEELTTGFENKWHHVSIAVKNHQMKVYVDQYRTLVVPDTKEEFTSLEFAGIGDEKEPIIFKNVRIALGGGMNMLGKKFTDAKIVTHGINFDVNKAIIKPESMGTLNGIVTIMKDNPEIKFEIGGHTDSDGEDAANLKLSQQRAEAVKSQLISMGIDAARLTSKGYGESKPVGDNKTYEGKANNRRVEFVKI